MTATANVDALVIRDLLTATSVARASGACAASRYAMDTVFIRVEGRTLELVATDGHRLHQTTLSSVDHTGDATALIDGAAIDALCKALRGIKIPKRATATPTVILRFSESGGEAVIQDPNTGAVSTVRLSSTYQTKDYPDFNAVMVAESEQRSGSYFGANPVYLIEAAQAAAKVSDTVRIQPGDNALRPVLVTSRDGNRKFAAIVMPKPMD